MTRAVGDDDTIELKELGLVVKVLFTPCHTSGHVLYYLDPEVNGLEAPLLFTGDTLFIGTIGDVKSINIQVAVEDSLRELEKRWTKL